MTHPVLQGAGERDGLADRVRLPSSQIARIASSGAPSDQRHRLSFFGHNVGDPPLEGGQDRGRGPRIGSSAPSVNAMSPTAYERPQRHRRGVVAHEAGQYQHGMVVAAIKQMEKRRDSDEARRLERDADRCYGLDPEV